MKVTNWDAIVTSSPLNKQAAIVRDGRGDLAPDVTITNSFAEQPLLRPYLDVPANDLSGKRFGELVVLGLGKPGSGGKRAGWVCQCDCGRFAQFSSQGLRKQEEIGRARCGECDYLDGVRKGTIRSPAERLILRHEKAASDAAERERMAILHEHFAHWLRMFEQDGVETDFVLRSMTHFIQQEKARQRSASRVPDAPSPSGDDLPLPD